jgi:murein DD-endopeptidase MepM/ murein hydrolase activator NlpD
MASISASVGFLGVNSHADVLKVQELLNSNRHRVPDGYEIDVDGRVGPKTIAAIHLFQRTVVQLKEPDGRVDPSGRTLRALNTGTKPSGSSHPMSAAVSTAAPKLDRPMHFPLRKRPQLSYHFPPDGKHKRYFGAPRKDKSGHYRAHAACDLIAPVGTEVLAVDDGTIVNFAYFYHDTNYVTVRHGNGLVVRYGEISTMASGLKIGATVTRGQVIAYVGLLSGGSHMLHFEVYAGTIKGHHLSGGGKFRRRADLLDPTDYLDQATFD